MVGWARTGIGGDELELRPRVDGLSLEEGVVNDGHRLD
jgi:hypothetical protein